VTCVKRSGYRTSRTAARGLPFGSRGEVVAAEQAQGDVVEQQGSEGEFGAVGSGAVGGRVGGVQGDGVGDDGRVDPVQIAAAASEPTAPRTPWTRTILPSTGPSANTAGWAVIFGMPRLANTDLAEAGTGVGQVADAQHVGRGALFVVPGSEHRGTSSAVQECSGGSSPNSSRSQVRSARLVARAVRSRRRR